MSNNTVYVVTGANRGIGLGLVKSLLARPSITIIASARDNEAATASKQKSPRSPQATTAPCTSSTSTFPRPSPPPRSRKSSSLPPQTSPPTFDVLITNAGFATPMSPAVTTTAEDLRSAFEVNTISPLLVFQAFWPLLQKARAAPKLIMITSSVGSIGGQEPIPGGAYGPSRAAGNWLTRAIHIQHEADGLVAVALHPGWVQTRAGEFVAKEWNYAPGAPETVENSVKGILEVVDGATREKAGGKFITYTGQELPW